MICLRRASVLVLRVGAHPDRLLRLIAGRRAALVPNALDGLPAEVRETGIRRDFADLGQLGLAVSEIDLREPDAAARLCGVDIVWVRGGNVFTLRRALADTGTDQVLTNLIRRDAIAYGGYSAGACVLAPDLSGLERVDDMIVVKDPVMTGLGVLDRPFVPHVRSPGHPETAACDALASWYRSAEQPHWALRDGEVLIVDGDATELLGIDQEGQGTVCGDPVRVRPYQPNDLDDLYRICLQTADNGQDATSLFRDPKLPGHVYAAPYVAFEPSLAFVAEDAGGVAGYIVAALDSQAFEQRLERDWWPALRASYPEPPQDVAETLAGPERYALHNIHHPWNTVDELASRFPSHLHIDLLPRLQGRGIGRQLIETLVASLRDRGSPGLHLIVGDGNQKAIGFYRHVGFTDFPVAHLFPADNLHVFTTDLR